VVEAARRRPGVTSDNSTERTRLPMNREHTVWQWVLQGTRDRIINGLRRRRAHPEVVGTGADGPLSDAGAEEPLLEAVRAETPVNLVARIECDERTAAVCEALDILRQARPQRQALPQRQPEGPALFPQLTRQEAGLQAPRWIRIGQDEVSLDKLALLIVFILVGMYGILALQYVRTQTVADRNELAVALVTAKDVAPLRLVAVSGVPSAANGTYWGRVGTDVAVLTLSDLPPAPEGVRYRGWVQHADRWTSIGGASPDAAGSARLIAESAELAFAPDALRVSLEPYDVSQAPLGPSVLTWPNN
jgi:anti-sigma-K factor RskA